MGCEYDCETPDEARGKLVRNFATWRTFDHLHRVCCGEINDRSAQSKVNAVLAAGGLTSAFAAVAMSTGADTVFVGWAHEMLPKLACQLRRAARKAGSPDDRYYFLAMAGRARQLAKFGE